MASSITRYRVVTGHPSPELSRIKYSNLNGEEDVEHLAAAMEPGSVAI